MSRSMSLQQTAVRTSIVAHNALRVPVFTSCSPWGTLLMLAQNRLLRRLSKYAGRGFTILNHSDSTVNFRPVDVGPID
jgi:hypothetical protein